MSGTRGGLARIVAMGIGLAVAVLLLVAGEARAGKYEVAQCGWYVGADASWADTTGGAKFRPDAWCVPPAGADPFDGAHMKSLTRDGQGTVSGTRFARWRWEAPAGTGITQVRGTWWHALHDGIEQRLGVGSWSGGFDVFAAAGGDRRRPARVRRRLHAGAAGARGSAALRQGGEQVVQPRPRLLVGDAGADDHGPGRPGSGRRDRRRPPRRRLAPRRARASASAGADTGAGIRFGETSVDGARVDLDRVPLRQGADRRRLEGDPDAALPARRLRQRRDRHHPLQRRPPRDPPLRHRLRRQRRLHARRRRSRSTTTRRPTPATWPSPAARGGAASTTSTSPGPTPTRARPARSPAPSGGSPARPATTPASSSRPARDLAALPDRFVPGPRRLLPAALAARRSRQRRPVLGARRAAALRRRAARASPSRSSDGAGRPRPDPRRRQRRPLRPGRAGRSSTAASTPSAGPSCRPRLQPDGRRPTGDAPGRRTPDLAPAPTSSAPMRSTPPATPPRPRCAPTAPRWRCARRRPGGAEPATAPPGPPRGRRRGCSRGCAAATGAATR